MAKRIPLTQGQFAIVDDWHFEELNKFKWHARWSKCARSFYAERNEGKEPHRQRVSMHRQVMKTPAGLECDHINHNTLDNRECNLRNATGAQNRLNKRSYTNNRLGIKCVRREGNHYRVRVKKDGHYVLNKTLPTLDEAIAARDAAIKRFHGEYSFRQ